MKSKKHLLIPMLFTLLASGCSSPATTSNDKTPTSDGIVINITDEQIAEFKSSPVNITLWSPISGPDQGYLQNIVMKWNSQYGDYLRITSDPQSEDNHYTRIITSFSDNSTADLTLIHNSRVAEYQRAGRLRKMTSLLSGVSIQKNDYLEAFWNANVFDNDVYALTYDLLPTLLFYNRKLIPSGYSEADITSNAFTLETMREMMKAAYSHAPLNKNRIYGAAFNYAFTETPFLNYLYEQNGKPVDKDQPTTPLFNDQKGINAANALRSIPLTYNSSNQRVASESGADHLDIYSAGRALFTIDGLWSSHEIFTQNNRIDTGVTFLPKLSASSEKTTYADSHCFVTFTNKKVSEQRDRAIALVLKYFVDNSAYWCKGGKVAVRNDTIASSMYQELAWSSVSNMLDKVHLPEKVYTYKTITAEAGEACSILCENKGSDQQPLPVGSLLDTAEKLNEAATKARQKAEQL